MSSFRSLRTFPRSAAPAVLCLVLLVLGACAAPTVDEMRAGYSVELNSWIPQPVEQAPVEMEDGEAAEGEDAEGTADDAGDETEGEDAAGEDGAGEDGTDGGEGEAAEGEGAEAEAAEPVAVATDILFDFVLRYNGLEALPGITLDISHADASQQEKAVYKHWVDTSSLLKGEPYQDSFKLEGVPFVEGDLFSMSIREYVPAEEQGDYREYAAAAP